MAFVSSLKAQVTALHALATMGKGRGRTARAHRGRTPRSPQFLSDLHVDQFSVGNFSNFQVIFLLHSV